MEPNVSFILTDFIIFFLAIAFSAIIGLYFGCFGNKQRSAEEYIYGRKNLKAIPVGISIYSSSVSAIMILGTPAEVYLFGSQFIFVIFGSLLSLIITWSFVTPVFNGTLNIKTPYEFFELRFNKTIRTVSSCLYIINVLTITPIVLYSCCVPFSEATGIDNSICLVVLGGICIIYTMLGGLSGVVWTDVLQAILMLIALFCILITGLIKIGGFHEMWSHAENGGRLNFFNFDPNPFQHLTFWGTTIGMMFNYAAHQGCAASTLQRYLSVRTEKDARISVFTGVIGYVISAIVATLIGLIMYGAYRGCDPVENKELKNYNQMAAYFAIETIRNIPGISGLYIAGVLSSGLSTVSAELNTLSGIIYYDFIYKNFKKLSSDLKGAIIMKTIVLIFGSYVLLVSRVMNKIQYLTQITFTISGISNGIKLGLIILGTAFPKINSSGALSGSIAGAITIGWIAIGATMNDVGSLSKLPLTTVNCSAQINNEINVMNYTTVMNKTLTDNLNEPLFIYKLSFTFYTMFGSIITIIVAFLTNYITGFNNIQNVNPKFLIPFSRPKIQPQQETELQKMLQLNKK